jgi:hypothetical protein
MRLKRTFLPLTPEHAEFLRNGAKPFAAEQTRLVELRSHLLDLGGLEVLWLHHEPHLDQLIETGRVFPRSRLRRRFIADSECHGNTAQLWYSSKGRIRIATGYALCDSGLWMPHSWGVEDGRIVETTSSRWAIYFGVELTGEEALKFVFANTSSNLRKRFERDLVAGICFPELVDIAKSVSERARSGCDRKES